MLRTTHYSRLFSLLMLFSFIASSSMENGTGVENLIITANSESPYVYFDGTLSSITEVLCEIGKLDDDNSHINIFNKYIADGLLCVEYDTIMEILGYAENVLQRNSIKLHSEDLCRLNTDLHMIIKQVMDGKLSSYRNHERFRGDKNATFDDVKIKKSLSVTDLFVANCIKNLCIKNLSAIDTTISNLTVTSSAALAKLSVTDATVKETLLVNDEVINDDLRFTDTTGGEYVGLRAPSVVPTSYTIALPAIVPTAHQILRTNSMIPTNTEWATLGTSIDPTVSKIIYVAKRGNDTTGNGSLDFPYATLSKAITVANGFASLLNPIAILISPGIYIENNSSGPIIVTAAGISITGDSANGVTILPNTPTKDLLLVNSTIRVSNLTLQSSTPLATGVSLTAGRLSVFDSVRIINFLVGVSCSGAPADAYGFISCLFINNGTALIGNNAPIECNSCTIFGVGSLVNPAANTGVMITGSNARMIFDGGVCGLCTTGFSVNDNSFCTINSIAFRRNTSDIIQQGASHLVVSACNFELTNGTTEVDIQMSGVGTTTEIIGCEFNGDGPSGASQGICLSVSDNAFVDINSSGIRNYDTAIIIGIPTDVSSTKLDASNVVIRDCAKDIVQKGSATLNFHAGTASSSKIDIHDATNVTLAFFDIENSGVLSVGSLKNQNTTLIQAGVDTVHNPQIDYKSSLYSSQAIGFKNSVNNPTLWFVSSANESGFSGITTDRTKNTSLQLLSDTGTVFGGTTALRGWKINKNGSTAELSFNYQNTDIFDQTAVDSHTVMQLDGLNNQLQLPTPGTQIVFAGDTNLYRSGTNVLKTDDNFVVGSLTPERVVVTSETSQLFSSIITPTELEYLSGTSAPVQMQLNTKVNKTGDVMSGALELPAGTVASPSLIFTGSPTTGISAHDHELSFSTNAIEQIKINAAGILSIASLTQAGVLHSDESGNISSSLIVDADIADATISNDKFTTVTSLNIPGNIVVRDISGNFAANMISLGGVVVNPMDAATKAYVDAAIAFNINSNFSTEEYTVPADNQVYNVAPTTSILLLSTDEDRENFTIIFPVSPVNGQFFTVLMVSDHTIEIINDGNINNGNPANIVNGVTSLDINTAPTTSAGGAGVTYVYLTSTNSWYRYSRA